MDERQGVNESTKEMLVAMTRYFPGLAKVMNEQVGPTAQAQLEADKTVTPEYAKLQEKLQREYAPKMADIAAGVDDITQKAASQRELDLAKTTGRALVTEADLAQRQLDPEFYKNREALSDSIAKYVKANDPTSTESELEEMRRGMGRALTNPNSAIDTAAKALAFGSAGRQKAQDFGNVIATVSNSLPAMRANLPGFEIATRRNVGSSTGENKIPGVTTNTGQQAYNMGNNMLNQVGAFKQQEMSKQKSLLDNVTGWGEFAGKVVGGVAGAMCWVAREVYGEDDPRWLMFRRWMLNKSHPLFRWCYIHFGENFARLIGPFNGIKLVIKRWMNSKI